MKTKEVDIGTWSKGIGTVVQYEVPVKHSGKTIRQVGKYPITLKNTLLPLPYKGATWVTNHVN